MPIEAELLGEGWRLVTSLAGLAAFAWAAATAPWRTWLVARTDRQHVWLGGLLLLTLIWSMRAGVTPGLSFHFLLATALTLMHGWRLALVAIGLVLVAICALRGGADWTAWGAALLCFGVVPAAVVTALHAALERWLPHNYFVYFFGTVFVGSMLAFNAACFARLALLAANGSLPGAQLHGEYYAYLPMLSLAEAFVNGIVMAMVVVYRPEWVASFDNRKYLRR